MSCSNLSQRIIVLNNINNWFQTDNDLKNINQLVLNQRVVLDFSKADYLDPQGIIMLLTISQNIFNETNRKLEIKNIRSNLLSYLERINLFKFDLFEIDINSLVWDEYGSKGFLESVIEITRITSLEQKQNLVENVEKILSMWFPEEIYMQLRYNTLLTLLELCGNSLEHSSSTGEIGECIFMLEKYSKRDHIEICMVIGDFGVGIKSHLNRKYGNLYKHDYQYIQEALNGKSGRSDGSGGMGFMAIQQRTKINRGKLTVKSNKGIVSIDDNINFFEADNGTIGTQCSIILKRYKN